MKTRMCIVRHGETSWNAEGRIQGHVDIPLNAMGEAQAKQLSIVLGCEQFQAVLSSHLNRAYATAEPIAASCGLSVQPCPELCERHYGIFQGLSYKEIEQLYPQEYAAHRTRVPDWPLPQGESLLAFQSRVLTAMQEIAANYAGQKILLVTHGGVLDIIYRWVVQMPLEAPRNFPIGNAALNWIQVEAGQWSLESWGLTPSTHHIRDEFAV